MIHWCHLLAERKSYRIKKNTNLFIILGFNEVCDLKEVKNNIILKNNIHIKDHHRICHIFCFVDNLPSENT